MPGSCLSKNNSTAAPSAAVPAAQPVATVVTDPLVTATPNVNPAKMVKKIAIIYYSTYGHIQTLARKIKEGVDAIEGVEGHLYQVPETLPAEVLGKMHAPAKATDVPIITVDMLPSFDAFIFGFPTRFGMMAAQFKAFLDATGGHWQSGALVGKPAGLFTSTATQNGGQETTLLTAVTQLVHHGMVFVPIGYSAYPLMANTEEVRGGSPYGAGTIAGPDGSRQPTKTELDLAEHQGKHIAGFVKRLQ